MAFLAKIKVIRYVDDDGRRCTSSTPGAKKVEEESKKWYGCYRDERRKLVRIPLSTDKESAQSMLAKLLKNKERGKAGLIDPFEKHLSRPVLDHLEEYLPVMRERTSNEVYKIETERIIRTIISTTGMKLLADFTAERIEDYLLGLTVAPTTKKKRHSAMNGFADWLFQRKRTPQQVMATVPVPSGTVVTEFRSLTLDEIQRLLAVAAERPVNDALTIRTGERRGQLVAKVRDEVRAALRMDGRGRRLLYQTAMFTGLRRQELELLQVWHLDLDHKPYPLLRLPGDSTKNKDDAVLLLVPELADEIKAWIADSGKGANDAVFDVPLAINKIFQRDLKAAAIPKKDTSGAVAKFRSLRKTSNMLLAKAGVPPKIRQLFMRHSDIRLTMQTYDDTPLDELAQAVEGFQKLKLTK